MMLIAAKIDGFTIYHIWWVAPSKFLKMFQEAFSFGTLLRTEGLFSVMDHLLSFGGTEECEAGTGMGDRDFR